jgi:hypothetical protein
LKHLFILLSRLWAMNFPTVEDRFFALTY